MNQRKSARLLLSFLCASAAVDAGAVFAGSPVAVAPPVVITIEAPCLKNAELNQARLDVQACSYVLRTPRQQFSSPSSSPVVGILDRFEQRVRDRINCYYKGYVPDIERQGPDSYDTAKVCDGGIPTNPDGPPKIVCNLADGEQTNNHLGQNCGAIRGPWEQSQMAGLWVQAVKKFRADIVAEIENKQRLGVSARCQAMATDYISASYPSPLVSPSPGAPPSAKEISDSLTSSITILPAAVYKGGVNFCQEPEQLKVQLANLQAANPTTVNAANLIQVVSAVPKAASCALAASRENRIILFGNIAECELWSRLNYFFALFADNESQNLSNVINGCIAQAVKVGNDVGHDKQSRGAGEAAGQTEFDNCYTPKIRSFFDGIDQQYLPGKFNTRNDRAPSSNPFEAGAGTLFALGSLLPATWRRRRPGKLARKTAIFFCINAVVLSFATYYSLGGCCGDDPSNVSMVAVCTSDGLVKSDSIPPKVKQCCQPAPNQSQMQDAVKKDAALCKSCNPAMCLGEIQAEDKGQAGYQGAKVANAQAAAYASPIKVISDNNPSPTPTSTDQSLAQGGDSQGASAGGVHGAVHDGSGHAGDSGPGHTGGASGHTPQGGSFGGRSGAIGLGSLRTGVLSNGATADQTGSANGSSGKYAAGNGGSGNAAGGGFHSGAGGAISAGEGASSSEVAFGGDANGADGKALTSDDPADYFTRLGLEDNIFKVVERRYRQKSMMWATSDVSRPAAKVSTPSLK